MANLNQIKQKILELEAGKFQRLCDDWLYRKGYENINPVGMMKTTDRVTKGTPDTLIPQSSGTYIFSECSVQQKRLAEKIESDIEKCFDELKTGIPNHLIEEIFIFFTGNLSTPEFGHLTSLCNSRSVKLSLCGLEALALGIQNSYPVLAELHLGLSLDTGQLLTINDFVARYGKHQLTTSIDNVILHQDENLSEAKKKIECCDFLLISGASGLGKTLFLVNLGKQLQKESEKLKVVCLFDKGADLIRDITAFFSEPGHYLILIDDANRLDSRLDYILHLLHESDAERSFKIIATVRDYARDRVLKKVENFTRIQEQIIRPLTNDQIRNLTEIIFNITNPEYQNRIVEISCGNPRLAFMASRLAVDTNRIESIRNVTSLYNEYFGRNDNIESIRTDRALMTAATAISFYRKVDKLNVNQMESIQNFFGLDPEQFWTLVETLHKHEIVDLYESEVVRISDQVLSTYISYLAIFESKYVPFANIVRRFYPGSKSSIVDILNPIIKAFDQDKIIKDIRRDVHEMLEEFKQTKEVSEILDFFNYFWFALPTEALLFVEQLLDNKTSSELDWAEEKFEESKSTSDRLVDLLVKFRGYGVNEFQISFELLLKYLEVEAAALGHVIRSFSNEYNFNHFDYRTAYSTQNYIADKLIALMDGGQNYLYSRLFICVADILLEVEHRRHQWSDGKTMNIITFRLSPSPNLFSLREKIFTNLSCLLNRAEYGSHIIELLNKYIKRLRFNGVDIVKSDMPCFTSAIVAALTESNLSHCLLIRSFCIELAELDIDFPNAWRDRFSNEIVQISDLLLEDRYHRDFSQTSNEEYEQRRLQRFNLYLQGDTSKKIETLLLHGKSLMEVVQEDNLNTLCSNIEVAFQVLAESKPDVFVENLIVYLKYDNVFAINPHVIIAQLFKIILPQEVWSLLHLTDFKNQDQWKSVYFALLPESSISNRELNLLYSHLKFAPSNSLRQWLDYLSKYQNQDRDIFLKSVRILVERADFDNLAATSLSYLFYPESEFFGLWFEIFKTEKELVFKAYLAAFKVSKFWDHDGKSLTLLLNEDFDFLFELVDLIYEISPHPDVYTNMPDLIFIWERGTFFEDIQSYAKYICAKEHGNYWNGETLFKLLFSKRGDEFNSVYMKDKKLNFIEKTVHDNARDVGYIRFIFSHIRDSTNELKLAALISFLSVNRGIDDFEIVYMEFDARHWSGSLVPILERERILLQEISSLLNSVDLLKHRMFLENRLKHTLASMDYEKKRDYLDSRE